MFEWMDSTNSKLHAMQASCDSEEELHSRIVDCSMMKNTLHEMQEDYQRQVSLLNDCDARHFTTSDSVFEQVEKRMIECMSDLCVVEKELNLHMDLISLRQDISKVKYILLSC